jgi:hypothetical protein
MKLKEVMKKEREWRLLERLRESYAGFPAGIICLQEKPDFLIKNAYGLVGVEVCVWAYDEDEGEGGSPTRRHESLSSKVVLRAQEIYNLTGLPPINVSVDFHPQHPLRVGQRQRLAAEIFSITARHLPAPGAHAPVCWPGPGWKELPKEVASIYISRPARAEQEAFWAPEGGGAIPEFSPAHVSEVIRKKERRLSCYRKSADTVWLLIAATGYNPSGFCKIDRELHQHAFTTGFDAVFFLQESENVLIPLLVEAAPANPGVRAER